jgi:tetratricopeptide (TPR) repeat protein
MFTRSLSFLTSLTWLVLSGTGCATGQIENEPWIEVRSANFRFVSQLDEARTTELANELEVFQSVLQKMTSATAFEPRVPTTIFLLRDTFAYRQFAPRGSAGVFIPLQRANLAVVNAQSKRISASDVLLHEYTHYVVHNDSTFSYPRWYDEGFAELMSGTDISAEHVDLGLPLAHRRMSIEDNRILPLKKMLTDDRRVTELENAILYAKGWRFVHYLHYGHKLGYPNRTRELARYLSLLHQGVAPADAVQQAFGMDFSALDQEFEEYLRKGQVPAARYARSSFPEPAPPTTRRMSADEVAIELGWLALARDDDARAESLFRVALATQPSAPRALTGLANALRARSKSKLQMRDLSQEIAALYTRALEVAPDDAMCHLDYAAHALAQARSLSRGEPQSALIRDARTHLARAIELDPSLPESHAKLAETHLGFEGEDPAAALDAATRAQALLSSSAEINYLLAYALFSAKRVPEAKRFATSARLRELRKVEGLEELEEAIDEALAAAPPSEPAPAPVSAEP